MNLVKIIDIETGEESIREADVSEKFPNIVYRNASTRALDEKNKKLLEGGFSPIPMGSCFTEGGFVLPLFAGSASRLGFYFGIEKSDLPQNRHQFLGSCEREDTIEIVEYQGRELIFPTRFI